MADPRVTRLARVLVDYSIDVQPGQRIAINGLTPAAPLIEAVYERILERGGFPELLVDLPGLNEIFMRRASEEQLTTIPPFRKMVFEQFEGYVNLQSQVNTRGNSSVDPARQRKYSMARAPLMRTYLERTAAGSFRWVLSQYPTDAYAQDADMSLHEYESFVYGACHVDGEDDPVAYWRSMRAEQARLVEWLRPHDKLVVRGPNVDLALSIKGRTFSNSDGSRNMPDGEIFTGPVETSVNGWVRFSYPAIRDAREVDGIEIRFEDGRAVKASARKNEEYLLATLNTDAGASFLGEFAIGTNFGINRFTRSILFDEKIGGTIHMAFGASYPETGGQNHSAVHWDMICDMRTDSEIRVDGELLYQNGQFKV